MQKIKYESLNLYKRHLEHIKEKVNNSYLELENDLKQTIALKLDYVSFIRATSNLVQIHIVPVNNLLDRFSKGSFYKKYRDISSAISSKIYSGFFSKEQLPLAWEIYELIKTVLANILETSSKMSQLLLPHLCLKASDFNQ